jgi:hypothetical protein
MRPLAELPYSVALYEQAPLPAERLQAAAVLAARGSTSRLHAALQLAREDWRDLLVGAGLADEDWPERLQAELGTEEP